MRLYLDTCCLNRPFDDQSQLRVQLETDAVGQLLRGIQERRVEWLISDVLLSELERRPDGLPRAVISGWLGMAVHRVEHSPAVAHRAERLSRTGLAPHDALHVASAEIGRADVFLTTDDRLIRAARRAGIVRLPVANPLEWLGEWNNENDP